jgi:hypothetical protein
VRPLGPALSILTYTNFLFFKATDTGIVGQILNDPRLISGYVITYRKVPSSINTCTSFILKTKWD